MGKIKNFKKKYIELRPDFIHIFCFYKGEEIDNFRVIGLKTPCGNYKYEDVIVADSIEDCEYCMEEFLEDVFITCEEYSGTDIDELHILFIDGEVNVIKFGVLSDDTLNWIPIDLNDEEDSCHLCEEEGYAFEFLDDEDDEYEE